VIAQLPSKQPAQRPRGRQRGQGLVEFALVVPIFLLLLLSMVDFGFAFYTSLTIEYATREGARVGAALASGTTATCADTDKYIIAAVERVLDSAGIRVDVDPSGGGGVQRIRIYKANTTNGGDTLGIGNQWNYSAGAGPLVPNYTPATRLDFSETSHGWDSCPPSRVNTIANPDSLGVSITYNYAYMTPLAGIYRLLFGGPPPTLKLDDHTVMQLNPTGG
jgi:hypothetical protein